jgi:hypothetical protein
MTNYRQEIARFAVTAKQLFVGAEKEPEEGLEEQYEQFWREYDDRLSRAIR